MKWTRRIRVDRRHDLVFDLVVDREEVAPDGTELRVYLRPENLRTVRRRRLNRAV